MKEGLPGDRLRLVDWSYREEARVQCFTPVWISAASVSTSICWTRRVRRSRSVRRHRMPTVCAALVPAIWLPDPSVRAERERWRLHLVRHRSSLKQRVHAVLLAHGKPCPVTDLFGVRGRQLLARLALPEPWQGNLQAGLRLIDELDREIGDCESELRRLGADHRYVPLLLTVPGIAWVLAYTIAAEVGDIARFPSPLKLSGYTGLCPRVYQSGESDRRGPLAKQGPRCLRWALVEAATHASTRPAYRDRYQRTKTRLGPPRRSGTCSPATNPSLRQAPPTPWPPDGP
jgi:transposase